MISVHVVGSARNKTCCAGYMAPRCRGPNAETLMKSPRFVWIVAAMSRPMVSKSSKTSLKSYLVRDSFEVERVTNNRMAPLQKHGQNDGGFDHCKLIADALELASGRRL